MRVKYKISCRQNDFEKECYVVFDDYLIAHKHAIQIKANGLYSIVKFEKVTTEELEI